MPRRILVLTSFVLLVLLFSGLTHVPPTFAAAPLIVNSLADAGGKCTASGICTLREAINSANSAVGPNTITFSVTGIITLGSALPALTDSVTIDGSGQSITVSGSGAYRVFQIAHGVTASFKALTIADGQAQTDCGNTLNCGGGIFNDGGTVTVSNSILSDNNVSGLGGAIFTRGSLTVSNSTFTGNSRNTVTDANGAAIYNEFGTLKVSGSTFSQNDAYQGSGIYNWYGKVTVTNSTFSGNITDPSATGAGGGGLYNNHGKVTVANSVFTKNIMTGLGWGGGILNNAGTLNLVNSTLSANKAAYGGALYNQSGTLNVTASTLSGNVGRFGGGGLYNDSGTLTATNITVTGNRAPSGNGGGMYNLDGTLNVVNSTIWGNSAFSSIFDAGGIYNDGDAVTLYNTIVANNSSYQCYDYAETLTADKFNLDDDGSCGNATQKTPAEIALGALQDNGGPTQTLKPGKGSAALDAGDDIVCVANAGSPTFGAGGVDQRGVKRPQGATCDIGSVEVRR